VAHRNKVVRSINDETGNRCVDIFVRPEGSFGFEEYRRDMEEGGAWGSASGFSGREFATADAAFAAAVRSVAWLAKAT